MTSLALRTLATLFLQCAVVCGGGAALVFLAVEPLFEGRNAHATVLETYTTDPFLVYVYIAAIVFFVGLYHTFLLFGDMRKGASGARERAHHRSLMRICALLVILFVVGGEVWLAFQESDDRAGGVFLGVCIVFVSAIVAALTCVGEG